MQKRLCLMIALLSAIVLGAWADGASSFSGGEGTVKSPYIIGNAEDWNQLGTDVAAGTSYSGQYFRLDADITVTTMVGTGTSSSDAKSFSGIFDGNSHKLTVNYATADNVATAPFRFLRNASIRNLHVDGTITANHKYAAGLAGRTYGTTLIEGCRVSTVIRSSVAGDATHGGIVALKTNWDSARLTIEGCVFDGKILTTGATATNCCGGFVGYTSYGSLTIRNSIFAPAAPAGGETAVSHEYTFYRYPTKNAGTISLEKSYYTQPLGTAQGKHARNIGFDKGVDIDIIPTGSAIEYGASGIVGYDGNQCVKYNGTVYAGNEDVVKLTFNHHYVGADVKYSIYKNDKNIAFDADENGIYTVTMADEDVKLAAQALDPGGTVQPEDGSEESPYRIFDAKSWDYFVSLVNKGEGNYATAYYLLTDDVTVTTMMGSSDYPFKGHFDGDVHKLTVSYNSDAEYTAPFRYVDGATISGLHVAGSITTSKKFAAGVIAYAKGNTTITNCRSSVTINSSVNGDGTHGGFVANNTSGNLTIEGCAFDGYMLGGKTNNCAGFVGWCESNNNATVSITNCLFAPKGTEQVIDMTFARTRNNSNSVTITNSHCTTNYNNIQQSRIYSIRSSEHVEMTYAYTVSAAYSVSGITFFATGLTFDGVLYAKKDDQLTLTLAYGGTVPTGCQFKQFDTTAGTLSGSTLTMVGANATIYATYTSNSEGWGGTGTGTEGDPYIIDSAERWEEFANRVNYGIENYASAYYQLGADNITVTTMVGNDGHKFSGHFDGKGKTLTVNYGTQEQPVSDDYCAPFRYIVAANIHNLNVEGSIYTNKKFAAGIAGSATGNSNIDKCRVSVDINSQVVGDGTHGGFVATIQNGLISISNSAFNGSMKGSYTNSCGGFVGWTESDQEGYLNISNCLFKPTELTIDADRCANFSRGHRSNVDGIVLKDSYYTSSLGTVQGEYVYASEPVNSTTPPEERTIAGVSYYVTKTIVENVAATGINPYQATISWTAKEACNSYQVYYRSKYANALFYTDFDDGEPEDWTMIDADGDGKNWEYFTEDDSHAHNGKGCFISASYINNYGELEPDNWLISPQLSLGGTLRVWLKGQDDEYNEEHFAIYLSTDGKVVDEKNSPLSSLITLVPETVTTSEYKEYVADLSAYSGQQGYIAIRHFNCYDQYRLVLDDFGIYSSYDWTTVNSDSPEGTTIGGLEPNTTYEYQVVYNYGGKDYYSPINTLKTLNDNVAPAGLSVTGISASTATINWEAYSDSYNVSYVKNSGEAKVTLEVPERVWQDESGYQMLLDPKHDTYGIIIPESGPLTDEGDASAETYARFEFKIPENADGSLDTENMIDGEDVESATITIPAGTYDWCITNPTPGDCVWIASADGNVRGRADDFVFEAGKHYTFTVTQDYDDRVDMTTTDDKTLAQDGEMKTVTGITDTSYALSGLDASASYTVLVQSVKGTRTSEWSRTSFTTLQEGELYLYDDQDNSGIIAAATVSGASASKTDVKLVGRTLYKDGAWNTLCLPFQLTDGDIDPSHAPTSGGNDGITFTGTPLEGAQVMGFDHASFDSATSTLELAFCEVFKIFAGEPYLVRWKKADPSDPDPENLVNPVFTGVTITVPTPKSVDDEGFAAAFVGTYLPVKFTSETKSVLYLGGDNTLYYPNGEGTTTIGSQRAYFQLKNGLMAGEPNDGVRIFKLNFGETGESQGITTTTYSKSGDAWYTLDGRRINGAGAGSVPAHLRKGLYINNDRKVVVK